MDDCPICLCPLSDAVRTKCNHLYCLSCFTHATKERTSRYRAAQCSVCRRQVSLYSTFHVESGEPILKPKMQSIFGSVYVQGGMPGVAAYHFDSPDDCYISYSHAPASWQLADGTPPPAKKPFLSPTYDASSRTFRGTVDWSDNLFRGDYRWEYEMVFAESLMIICDGWNKAYDAQGNLLNTSRFPHELRYWLKTNVSTIFGQVYVQDGFVGLGSYHFESPELCYIVDNAMPSLADGPRSADRKNFESPTYDPATRTFRAVINWDDEALGGSRRSEYEMIFSETFDRIVGGMVHTFLHNGERKERYGAELEYLRHSEEVDELVLSLANLRSPD
ncbi:MAG: hypothetical protein SGPRY_007829 [Prymnesium sp.]